MSNGTDRKSMDDVLASIRRIVRAEKEPDTAQVRPGAAGSRDHDDAGDTADAGRDEPLALTPDMRLDGGEVEPEAISHPSAGSRPGAASAGAAAASAARPGAAAAAVPDRETLRGIVREILLEELAGGGADGADDARDAVRGIIRDELMNGDIGENISQNVLRLIQSEVAKALENR